MKKLSELSYTDMINVSCKRNYDGTVIAVEDFINEYEQYYKNKEELKVHTTKLIHASFDAEDMLNDAIESECCNSMYEGWDESINYYITKEDIEGIQIVLDRILARSPETNVAYQDDELVEIDI